VLAAATAEGMAVVTDQAERLAGLTGVAVSQLRMVRACYVRLPALAIRAVYVID
jgi:hypothetical protein